ncbi:MAG: methyltransferase [Myxococcales bacterium]|nr:methyltransferase [Myxococcales bacterium]
MSLGAALSAADAELFDSVVVPRYLEAFVRPASAMLIPFSPAIVAVVGCRTGFTPSVVLETLPEAAVYAVDDSPAALDRAKTRLAASNQVHFYHAAELPSSLPSQSCTHAVAVHPLGVRGDYSETLAELYRLLAPGGQMVVAMPLRGSFPEIYDMLREYALRHEQPHFGEIVDSAAGARPNPETLGEQCERAGLAEVDIGVDLMAVSFDDGRNFLEDPIARLVVSPDVRSSLGPHDGVEPAMAYVAEAVGKYWSEIGFDLTVNIGCVTARRPT